MYKTMFDTATISGNYTILISSMAGEDNSFLEEKHAFLGDMDFLSFATKFSHNEVISYLLDRGVSIPFTGPDSPVCISSRRGDAIQLKKFVDAGAVFQSEALLFAIHAGSVSCASLLLQNGVPIVGQYIDETGQVQQMDALSEACKQDRTTVDMLQLLLAYGADPNSKDSDGNTPLHHVVSVDNPELISLLLDCGADPKISNNLWQLPHQLYDEKERYECTLLLSSDTPVFGVH